MVTGEWKDIKGYEGLYQINTSGEIKTLRSNKIMKYGYTTKGYKQVGLYKNKKCKHLYVHRLVAEAFIPNPNNYPIINHKDENKLNNCVNNLEWCTNQYNLTYKNAQKNRKRSVIQYNTKGKFIKKWECIKEVEKKLNIANPNICKVCCGFRKTAGGYIWRYAND